MTTHEPNARHDDRRRVKIGANLYERGGRYQVRKEIGGKQVSRTLKATTRTQARDEALRVLAEIADGGLAAIGDRTITVEALAESFLLRESGPHSKMAPRTLEIRRSLLRNHVTPRWGRARGPRTSLPRTCGG